MNKKLLVTLSAAGLLAFSPATNGPLPIGSSLPKADAKIMDISGQTISLGEAKKKNGLLVMFSCNTCPVVRAYQERTRQICQYAQEHELGVVLLNSNEGSRSGGDSYQDMQSYAKKQSYQWFYAVDKDDILANAFGANRTPECFLFDANSKLVYHGAIDDSPGNPEQVRRQHLKEAISEMLDGKEVSIKESRSIGCSIRRS
jgi:hypothetical protein